MNFLKIALIVVLTFSITCLYSQTPKQVNSFPEEYVGKTIIFKNTAFWARLHELSGYYEVLINVSEDLNSDEWGFGSLDKVYGSVGKSIAKQMINMNMGGDNSKFYYGSVTGKIIKSSRVFGSEYIFLITKIVNHPIDEPQHVIHIFSIPKK